MPGHAKETILPLPLKPFEDYMLADDRPAYPMEFFMRLRFAGRFDRAALEAALATALSRHPLLTAVVQSRGRKHFWHPAPAAPVIQWKDEEPSDAIPNLDALDITTTAGMRVVALAGSQRTDLVLQCHHVCVDGIGCLGFIEDWLILYAQSQGVLPGEALPAIDLQQLRHRGMPTLTAGRWLKALGGQAMGLPGICRFLFRKCDPLVERPLWAGDRDRPQGYPSFLTHRLTEPETAAVIGAARSRGVTVNDLLVREFLRALGRQYSLSSSGQPCLRACVPVNLRAAEAGRRLSAANGMTFVFLNCGLPEIQDPERLVTWIHHQMQKIKRWSLGLTFPLSLALCQKLGILPWMCRRNRCLSTGVIANLGLLLTHNPLANEHGRLVIGDVVLETVEPLSTWRPLTSVAIAALTYAGRLSLTLHYDQRVLSPDEATEFFDGFARGLCPQASAPHGRP